LKYGLLIENRANVDLLDAIAKLNRLRGDDLMLFEEEKRALEDAEAQLRGLLS